MNISDLIGAVVNEHDDVRYFLDQEPFDLLQCDKNNNYDTEAAIVCIECAPRCSECGAISVSSADYDGECIFCKGMLCEDCIFDRIFVKEDGTEIAACSQCEDKEIVIAEEI